MKKNGLTMFFTIVFLAGCASRPTPAHPPASLTPIVQAAITPAITRLPEPTPTLQTVITPTTTILPEPTATPKSRFTRQCLSVNDSEVELNEIASGTILFSQTVPKTPPPGEVIFALKDLQTGSEYKLPDNSVSSVFLGLEISPNQKLIALLEVVFNAQGAHEGSQIRTVLWVFDARTEVVAKMAFDRTDIRGMLRWLDDERLLIDTEQYGVLLLANPFTGEQQVISDELPNLFPYPQPNWPVVYSPDLEWVAYYSYSARAQDGTTGGPAVYDVVKKQTLWNAGNRVGSNPPVWSPDGQEVAFTGGMGEYQLYLVNHSGQVNAVLDESLPHEAFAFSWSPDGRYIAFWNAERLMVYDRQMDWVFDTCVSSNRDSVSPRWSPDSKQMIVYVSGYSTPMILVDWQEKMAYKIKELPHDGTMYGWMNSIP